MVDARLSADAPWDGYAELWWRDRASYEQASWQRLAEREAEAKRGVVSATLTALSKVVEPHLVV